MTSPLAGLAAEVRLMIRRGRQGGGVVPRRHKVALGAAGLVMALTSVCNTAMPLLLGRLVDRVKVGTESDWPAAQLYRVAAVFLGLLALAYVVREALNVLRRYLVENTCTRINRDMCVHLVS